MPSRTKIVLTVTLIVALLSVGQALAATTWMCALHSAVACDEDGTVGPPDLSGLEPPTFLRVDAERKQVTLLAPESRKGEVTVIDSIHQGAGIWVFSGVEADRAWSLVIADEGYLTLSVTTDGATWSVFGNALREE